MKLSTAFILAFLCLSCDNASSKPAPAPSSSAPAASAASAPTPSAPSAPSAVASASAKPAGVPGKYPQGSTRKLNDMELTMEQDAKDCDELSIMKNEIYARHGFRFKTKKMADYFAKQSWYEAKSDDVEKQLSDIEHANVALVTQIMKVKDCK